MRLVVLAVTLVACGVPGIPPVEGVILCCLGILLRQRALEEAMTTTFAVDGRSVVIPAKAKVGTRWSALA